MAQSKKLFWSSAFLFTLLASQPALAQSPSQNPTVERQPVTPALATPKPRLDRWKPRDRHLIYVTLPGTLVENSYRNGLGIVVLDANDGYRFIKRIPTWAPAASISPEQVAGVAASPVTNMIYLAMRGRLGAFDLKTEKMIWENEYDGFCCERPQVTADGSALVVGSDLKDFWYVVNPRTGDLITKIHAPQSNNAHNLNISPDGKLAFMAPNGPVMSIGDIQSGKVVQTIRFGDNVRPFVLNKDASLIYANTNKLLGYEVADVKTGKVIKHVEAGGDWREKVKAMEARGEYPGHHCESHGIALVNDEKEVWIVDNVNKKLLIFDNTLENPKVVAEIETAGNAYWITVGLDGDHVYLSSGDVIDTKTRKVVAQLKDEYGDVMHSEKLLGMMFSSGELQRVTNQFGNGYGDFNALGQVTSVAAR